MTQQTKIEVENFIRRRINHLHDDLDAAIGMLKITKAANWQEYKYFECKIKQIKIQIDELQGLIGLIHEEE